jgi:hypothetical protein
MQTGSRNPRRPRNAQTTGSLLLATTAAEMTQLEARATMLQAKGVEGVRLLTQEQVLREEPALGLQPSAAGLLVESDAQIVSLGRGVGGRGGSGSMEHRSGARRLLLCCPSQVILNSS